MEEFCRRGPASECQKLRIKKVDYNDKSYRIGEYTSEFLHFKFRLNSFGCALDDWQKKENREANPEGLKSFMKKAENDFEALVEILEKYDFNKAAETPRGVLACYTAMVAEIAQLPEDFL